MSRRLLYLDSSAALKMFKPEAESDALLAWTSAQGSALAVTSDLTRTELRRALHRANIGAAALRDAEAWLEDAALVRLTTALYEQAGRLLPRTSLRTLDALHVVAALSLGPSVAAFVAYDKRLLEAAQSVGLKTEAPA